jgi:hypothetical protein
MAGLKLEGSIWYLWRIAGRLAALAGSGELTPRYIWLAALDGEFLGEAQLLGEDLENLEAIRSGGSEIRAVIGQVPAGAKD